MTDILFLTEILVAALLVIGAVFTLIGSYGLLKLDQPMKRLHAPTKASTLGVGSLLLASMIHGFTSGEASLHELLVMAFLFATAPISGNFIAKVHLHRQRGGKELPAPPSEERWATYSEQ
ncbi:Na+/H+ antiporter subunit G [Limimaricola litoreus]|uniref:Na+/H+ antiporter subunit G n=1 Tax=Limimaricola litoreus TaxID=2955316 RepID=A0A9X2FQ71_9RHOB|nr:Na+/H+ antiporter subunit G [Limimaricola litoreus]MCP1169127.1 Na+/H+ antiporter subunit G [Limimaricola litoreus]